MRGSGRVFWVCKPWAAPTATECRCCAAMQLARLVQKMRPSVKQAEVDFEPRRNFPACALWKPPSGRVLFSPRAAHCDMATIPEALAIALAHHQAGRLPEAESIYRQSLALEPTHVVAWHLLGVMAHQVGQPDAGAGFLTPAGFGYVLLKNISGTAAEKSEESTSAVPFR